MLGQWSTSIKNSSALYSKAGHHIRFNCSSSAMELFEISRRVTEQPPPCVFILFIHVEKSGGSTWTSIFQNRTLFQFISYVEENGDPSQDEADLQLWEKGEKELRLSWGTVRRALSTNDDFIRKHSRLVLEVHGRINVRHLLEEIESLGHNHDTAFSRRGCQFISFMNIREPMRYLKSNIATNLEYFPNKALLEPEFPVDTNPDALGYRSFLESKSRYLVDLECRFIVTYLGDEEMMDKIMNQSAPQLDFNELLPSLDKIRFIGLTSCHSLNILLLAHILGEPELLQYSNLRLNVGIRNLPSYVSQFMEDAIDKSLCDKSLYSHGISRFREEIRQRFGVIV